MDRYSVADTVGLYENNYKKLLSIFPRLRDIEGSCVLGTHGDMRGMRLDIVERCPYTAVIEISHEIAAVAKWLQCASIRLRVYYDAEVVEVISYQNQHRFKSRYSYPNEKMLYPHEKRIVNLFLAEWLEHCLASMQGQSLPVTLTSAQ